LIDYVIHVVKNTDKTSPILFKYGISNSIQEIKKGCKTRYYPVEMSEVSNIVRNKKAKYAIIGIPSFIKAIRVLAQYDDIRKDRILYTVGLICGHQKSRKFSEYMAWQVGIEPGSLNDIDFRYKLEN
jgi:coenzyme F420 hydrogenase subunit beta